MKNLLKKSLILLFTNIFLINNAFADVDNGDVKKFVNDLGNKIVNIASNKQITVDEKRDKLIQTVEAIVDSRWIARFILAKHYRTATKEQRERFQNLYREFIIHTYAPSFQGYNNETFEVVSAIKQGKYYLTKCLFIPKEGPKVNVGFRLKKNKQQEFVLLDVIAEGVSLIETQRSEFGSVISTKGLEGFLSDLEKRVKSLKTNPPKTSQF